MSPAPLRQLTRGYKRESATDNEIAELQKLPLPLFWQRVAGDRADTRIETLVYFIREYLAKGESDAAWRIAIAVQDRTVKSVLRYISRMGGLSHNDREDLKDAVVGELFQALLSLEPDNEFWEVRFALCLKRLMIGHMTRRRRIADHEFALTVDGDDGAENAIELIADSGSASVEDVAVAKTLLNRLGEPLNRVFYLSRCERWTEDEIAAHIGKSPRTVRNYLYRAEERIASWSDG